MGRSPQFYLAVTGLCHPIYAVSSQKSVYLGCSPGHVLTVFEDLRGRAEAGTT